MEKRTNRVMLALGMAGAVLLLLGAFMLLWLVPRGPENTSAETIDVSKGVVVQPAQPAHFPVSKDIGISAPNSLPALQSETGSLSVPHISVRGTGSISAKPDMATMQVGVQIQKDTLDAAQAEAATKIDAAMNQLKGAGIAEKDISTAQYSVEPVMDYSRNNEPPRLIGFRVTNILAVKIRDISKAGAIIDGQVKAGANTVYGVSFSFSDPSALMRQAREAAVRDAKEKAEHYASLSGVTLGAPIVITDGGSNMPPMPMPAADMAAERGAGNIAVNQITPGQQEVRIEVSVAYSIK
jgi:uncharacterized protein